MFQKPGQSQPRAIPTRPANLNPPPKNYLYGVGVVLKIFETWPKRRLGFVTFDISAYLRARVTRLGYFSPIRLLFVG
jgi:hypothetical protein